MTTKLRMDESGELRAAMDQLGRCFEALKPFVEAVDKAMRDFSAAVAADPQLARLIEEHARLQGLDRG